MFLKISIYYIKKTSWKFHNVIKILSSKISLNQYL